jgi:molybdenum cofactor cytidylyltransferase
VVQTALRIQEASLTVVTNRDVDRAGALTGLNINVIINEQPARGLGSSIKQAVAYSQAQGRQACLMLLGDQPFVGSDHLQRMIRLHHVHPDSIVASAYGAGGRGVPGLFPAAFYADLCAISDQEGAKEVIHSSPDIVMVELDQDALFDLDTPAHLVFLAERE